MGGLCVRFLMNGLSVRCWLKYFGMYIAEQLACGAFSGARGCFAKSCNVDCSGFMRIFYCVWIALEVRAR